MEDLLLMSGLEGGLLWGFYGFYMMLAFVWPIAVYVLQSLGLYKMAQNRGINKPWLAWIPVGESWILGSLADQYRYVAKGEVTNRRKVLMWLYIAYFVVFFAFMAMFVYFIVSTTLGAVGGVVSDEMLYESLGAAFGMLGIALVMLVVAVVMAVFQYIALYDLYKSCDPNNATLFLLLSIFLSVAMPFIVFFLRNKEGGMPPRREVIAEE